MLRVLLSTLNTERILNSRGSVSQSTNALLSHRGTLIEKCVKA